MFRRIQASMRALKRPKKLHKYKHYIYYYILYVNHILDSFTQEMKLYSHSTQTTTLTGEFISFVYLTGTLKV